MNIAIVGLGQIGNYLYHEILQKKKELEIISGKKINISAISARNKDKKRKYKINKKIFYTNPFEIINLANIENDEKQCSEKLMNTAKEMKIKFTLKKTGKAMQMLQVTMSVV